MNKLFLLLKVEGLTYFSINEFRQGQKKSSKNITLLSLSIVVFLLVIYNFLNAIQLIRLGQADFIPAHILTRASLLVFFLTFFQYNGFLFENRDFERLMVLPIDYEQLVLAKVAFLYLINLFLTTLFMFPAGLAWLLHGGNSSLLLAYFILTAFVPLIPMSLVAMVASGIQVLSGRVKNQPLLAFGFSLVALFSIIALTLAFLIKFQGNPSSQAELTDALLGQIDRLYPLSSLFINQNQFWGNTVLFIVLSLLSAGTCFWIQARLYRKLCLLSQEKIMRKVSSRRKQHSRLYALCQKEFRRFFHSYLYMLQGGAGMILFLFLSIGLLIFHPEQFLSPTQLAMFKEYLPFFLASFFVVASPATSALSLEGTSYWILASLPVSQKHIVQAKLSVSIFLFFLVSLLVLPIFVFRFELTVIQLLSLLLILFSYGLFTAVQGLYCNILFPRFDWETEVLVLKQSKAVLFSSFIGGISLLLPLVLIFLKLPSNLLVPTVALLLIFASYLIYRLMLHGRYLFKTEL